MKKLPIIILFLLWTFLFSINTVFAQIFSVGFCSDITETNASFCDIKDTFGSSSCYLEGRQFLATAGKFKIIWSSIHSSMQFYEKLNDNPEELITSTNEAGSKIYDLAFGDKVLIYIKKGTATCNPYTIYAAYPDPNNPTPVSNSVSVTNDPEPYIYPEDEYGVYYLTNTGKKEYIQFHTYQICTDFMENANACELYPR